VQIAGTIVGTDVDLDAALAREHLGQEPLIAFAGC
jgi:hypothetical protein